MAVWVPYVHKIILACMHFLHFWIQLDIVFLDLFLSHYISHCYMSGVNLYGSTCVFNNYGLGFLIGIYMKFLLEFLLYLMSFQFLNSFFSGYISCQFSWAPTCIHGAFDVLQIASMVSLFLQLLQNSIFSVDFILHLILKK